MDKNSNILRMKLLNQKVSSNERLNVSSKLLVPKIKKYKKKSRIHSAQGKYCSFKEIQKFKMRQEISSYKAYHNFSYEGNMRETPSMSYKYIPFRTRNKDLNFSSTYDRFNNRSKSRLKFHQRPLSSLYKPKRKHIMSRQKELELDGKISTFLNNIEK